MARFMRTLVLLHVVFACKRFPAGGAVDVFLARVLFTVAGGVAGGGECVGAFVFFGVRTGIFFLGEGGGGCSGGGTTATVLVLVLVLMAELVIGVARSVLMGATVDEVTGGAEVGSFLAFAMGIWGWLD